MQINENKTYIEKAERYKRPLKERTVYPKNIVEIEQDASAFQGLCVVPVNKITMPLTLECGDKLLLDFGEHCVGYLKFVLHHAKAIADSPVKLRFSFGEFPLEIVTPHEEYKGTIGNGWLQYEEKTVAFLPYSGSLERRYSFRYLLIERMDKGRFAVDITDIFATCVSAVHLTDTKEIPIDDEELKKIYDISLKTLRDCEQDVFEDGPKRDRRLWIGDLRLQALTDYKTFQNYDLIRRCIYLFAGYRAEHKMVAPCVFPDSSPCVGTWTFADYSLFFISCLYDYMENTDDLNLVEELYDIALEQVEEVSVRFSELKPFIDWCPGLDKSVAFLGVYIYTLKQLRRMAEQLGKVTDWIESEVEKWKSMLLRFYSKEEGLFIAESGQISWHSQIWTVLSGILPEQENRALLKKTQEANPEISMHTPYMMHYYIEALYSCGLKQEAMDVIKDYWGKIIESGFDCCPEVFNPSDEFESPYLAPEINSACHAWSCTPAYWISRFYQEKETK
jgi:hypothetical protein